MSTIIFLLPRVAPSWDGKPRLNAEGDYFLAKEGSEIGTRPVRAYLFGEKIELARATAESLRDLPGIGQKTAQSLLILQTKKTIGWKDVDAIRGIGPKKLSFLKAHITLNPIQE